VSRYSYDPIYSYRNWHYGRRNPDWYHEHRDRHDRIVRNEDLRPPHTWHAQRELLATRGADRSDLLVAASVQQAIGSDRFGVRLARLEESQRKQFRDNAESLRHCSAAGGR
jgi:hypothetical protein